MKRILFILLCIFGVTSVALAQSSLNSLLWTYSQEIKVCNTPYSKTCITDTDYVRTSIDNDNLIIEYGFAFDADKDDFISHNKIIIDLKTALIYTGFWFSAYKDSWEHYGDKAIITIEDKEGMELVITGAQSYNQGVKNKLVDYICFSFGSEALADKVLKQLQTLQKGKRYEVEPWLKPKAEENVTKSSETITPKKEKKSSIKTEQVRPKTLLDKYAQ